MPPGADADRLRPARSEDRARILEGIARGRSWLADLTCGRIPDTDAIALSEGCSERSVRMTLALAFLSSALVRLIVEGRLPRGIGLARLAELPPSWAAQHDALGM